MANRESQYLKASEVAEILNMDISGIYKMCAARVIPSIKVGEKAVRIPRAAFEAYLARQAEGYDPNSRPLLDEARKAEVSGDPVDAIVLRNQSFYERTGYSSYQFAERWKTGDVEDTPENASLLIEALSIREALTRAGVGDPVLV
jgi:excisionase family DNA binding protein